MSGKLIGEHRNAAHQRDRDGQASRWTVTRTGPGCGRRDRHRSHQAVGASQPLSRIMPMAKRDGDMKPKQSEQGLAGGFAQSGEIFALNGHFRIPNRFTNWPLDL
jgi:hypothetical protein